MSETRLPSVAGGAAANTSNQSSSNPGGIISVQPLQRRDMQPSYQQDLGVSEVEHGCYGSMINCLGYMIGGLGQIPCCFCCPNPFHEVKQGSVGLVSRFGKFYKSVDPGLVQVNPCSEKVKVISVKIQLSNVPHQTVMTKDNVNVEIDSVIYWHISNPYRAAYGITDVGEALVERSQTTLRDVVGSRNLQSVVSDREGVAVQVAEIVENVAERWGVTIESILIKDIIFSRELQESLSSAATQRRVGESKVIAARAEVDAARLMRQAADILSSPAAMQIRQLEALQAMARQSQSKVLFVPMSLNEMGHRNLAENFAGPSTQPAVGHPSVDPVTDNKGENEYNDTSDKDGKGLNINDVASYGQLAGL